MSGAMATNPCAAKRRVTSRMCALTPKASWTTMMPGCSARAGGAATNACMLVPSRTCSVTYPFASGTCVAIRLLVPACDLLWNPEWVRSEEAVDKADPVCQIKPKGEADCAGDGAYPALHAFDACRCHGR